MRIRYKPGGGRREREIGEEERKRNVQRRRDRKQCLNGGIDNILYVVREKEECPACDPSPSNCSCKVQRMQRSELSG